MTSTAHPALMGIDFTSAPTRKKPITVAHGRLAGAVLRLDRVDALPTMPEFDALLRASGPWLAAFDFPFGLPREFVAGLGLGSSAQAVVDELLRRCATRMDFRRLVDAWGNARPAGQRLIHRATDAAMPSISSTSPLQTRYVPVGFMYFEGFSRVLRSGAHVPGMHAGDTTRTALEAYPGLLAHEVLGRRSYKNSTEPDRLIARKDLVDALEQGRTRLGLRLKLSHAMRDALVDDASGDRLDAVLCLLQAGWASMQNSSQPGSENSSQNSGQPGYGLPPQMDPLEGWITSAPWPIALAA